MKGINQDSERLARYPKLGRIVRESSTFGKFQEAVNEAVRLLQIGVGLGRCNAHVQELISLSLALKYLLMSCYTSVP